MNKSNKIRDKTIDDYIKHKADTKLNVYKLTPVQELENTYKEYSSKYRHLNEEAFKDRIIQSISSEIHTNTAKFKYLKDLRKDAIIDIPYIVYGVKSNTYRASFTYYDKNGYLKRHKGSHYPNLINAIMEADSILVNIKEVSPKNTHLNVVFDTSLLEINYKQPTILPSKAKKFILSVYDFLPIKEIVAILGYNNITQKMVQYFREVNLYNENTGRVSNRKDRCDHIVILRSIDDVEKYKSNK